MTSTTPEYHTESTLVVPETEMITAFLGTVTIPGEPFEIRVLNTRFGGPSRLRYNVYSGFFDSVEMAAQTIASITGQDAAGVYVTLNPLDRVCLNWNYNILGKSVASASDTDVTALRLLYLDIDPVRPRMTCATAGEHQMARVRGNEVVHYLGTEHGFPMPVWAGSSGSGVLALWRIDLPPERSPLIERVLCALSARFSDDVVKIDTTVHNPARIVRDDGT